MKSVFIVSLLDAYFMRISGMNKTKISYADYTWNPVWGCRTGCDYCYARKVAHRFGKSFEPHWMQKNFETPMPRKPSIIFVNSMSDIFWWTWDWTMKVLERIAKTPQHQFLFLTKRPETYNLARWREAEDMNVWYGFTATNDEEVQNRQAMLKGSPRAWCSAEPLLGPIDSLDPDIVKWLVIGAMTGPNSVEPREEWIDDVMIKFKGPIFMKRNMPEGIKKDWPIAKQYPAGMK